MIIFGPQVKKNTCQKVSTGQGSRMRSRTRVEQKQDTGGAHEVIRGEKQVQTYGGTEPSKRKGKC